MSTERRRVLFRWQCGDTVRFAKDLTQPYQIVWQRYGHHVSGRELVSYEVAGLHETDQGHTQQATPAELAVWRWRWTQQEKIP